MLRAYQGDKRNSWEMERRWRFLWFIWSKGHFFKPQKKNQWAPINLKSFLWIKSSFINPAVLMLQTDRQESVTWMFQPALGNDTVILWGIREVDSSSYTKIKSWGEEVTGQTPPISCRESGAAEVPMTFLTLTYWNTRSKSETSTNHQLKGCWTMRGTKIGWFEVYKNTHHLVSS